MGEKIEIALQPRTQQGKAVKKLRQEGFVPGVVYGQDFQPQSVMASAIPLTKAYKAAGKHHPVELSLAGQKRLAMVKAADVDPIKHKLRHIAFHVIKQNEKVTTEIPVHIKDEGETPAEKAGLIVLKTIESVEVEALPNDLPDVIEAPGERLTEEGVHLTVADLLVPKGVTILSDPSQVVVSVTSTAALMAANDAAGGDAEPGDEAEVPAEEGSDTPQDTQAPEDQPGGKKQFQPAKD